MKKQLIQASWEALFRHQVVSAVLAKCQGGMSVSKAVDVVAAEQHWTLKGENRKVVERTVWRWLAAWKEAKLAGLEPADRERSGVGKVLPPRLVEFITEQKKLDRFASTPELIKRAVQEGIIAHVADVDRVTVWRTLKLMGLPTPQRAGRRERDMRRWGYPHRMQMTLCDGKHFRAGGQRAKRVAMFFLDNATRRGLEVRVGTSESAWLFLNVLFDVVSRFGLMDAAYLDRGSGFKAGDTREVMARLERALIMGTAGYPEGHGEIERFNQTATHAVLRNLDGRADVDPDVGSLTLRLRHYLFEVYNQSPHEGLGGKTPQQCWDADERPLCFPESMDDLRARFVVHVRRKVTMDNVLPVDQVDYEVPRGHADTSVVVHRHVLDRTVWINHQDKMVQLHPVDREANAVSGRAKPTAPRDDDNPVLPPTAAEMMWRKTYAPVVGPDGGCLPGQANANDDDNDKENT